MMMGIIMPSTEITPLTPYQDFSSSGTLTVTRVSAEELDLPFIMTP